MTFRHWLAHRLNWHTGKLVFWFDARSRQMVGFRCSTCRRVEGVHPVYPMVINGKVIR